METKRSKWSWYDIDFAKANQKVLDFQYKIALAYENNDLNKVKQLQDNLVKSWSAIYVAVLIVTSDDESKTPGVDGELWSTKGDKENAAILLKKLMSQPQHYRPGPVRKVEISEANGKMIPARIPTMIDRSYRILWNLARIPITECVSNEKSSGLGAFSLAQDSTTYLWLVLVAREKQPDKDLFTWALDTVTQRRFDSISCNWLLLNIPIDKVILKKRSKVPVELKRKRNKVIKGIKESLLQEESFSFSFVNLVLDGLERL